MNSVSEAKHLVHMALRINLLILCLALSAVAFGECAAFETLRVVSPDSKHTLVVEENGAFTIATPAGKALHQGHCEIIGHHAEAFLFNGGKHFALVDAYEGIAIYDTSGKALQRTNGSSLTYWRVNRWACHPEGCWLVDAYWNKEAELVLDVGAGPDSVIVMDRGKAQLASAFGAGPGSLVLICASALASGVVALKLRRRR